MKLKAPPTNYQKAASHRGAFVIRQTKWGLVAQAWPKRRPSQKKPYQRYQQAEFAYASHWAVSPEPIAYQTAIILTKDTLLVPRDMLVMAMYANAFEFIMPDGSTLERFRDVAPNPQYVLDLVTELVGSLLVRTNDGWVGLDLGNDGDVLTVVDGRVEWAAPSGGGGGVSYTQQMTLAGTSSSSFATKGNIIEMEQNATLESVCVVLSTLTADAYELTLVELSASTVTAIVAGPEPFTSTANGTMQFFWKIAARPLLDATKRYAILCSRTTGPTTTALAIYTNNVTPFGIPTKQSSERNATLAANHVTVGAVLSVSGYPSTNFALPLTVSV